MRVTLIASTVLAGEMYQPYTINRWMANEDAASHADTLAEFAGRACYQSFDKPNPNTRSNKGYLANILRQQHESVLEHASASFYVEGVSRNLLLELERHRHLSFSVISQRYVDSSETEFVHPPALQDVDTLALDLTIGASREVYQEIVEILEGKGYGRKQAREAARAILPGGIETKFVVTGNMRAWRDVLRKRYSIHADAEIRKLASELLKQLREIAPNSFQDFPEVPFD